MIDTITLKHGRTVGGSPITFKAAPITILVGPNNSGKTRLLTEILNYANNARRELTNRLLDALTFQRRSREEAERLVDSLILRDWPERFSSPDQIVIGRLGPPRMVSRKEMLAIIENPIDATPGSGGLASFTQNILGQKTMLLDGATRLNLTNEQQGGDLASVEPASFPLQYLFRDDLARARLRDIVADAIGEFLVVDPSRLGRLRLRLSAVKPSPDVERSLSLEAVSFFKTATPIEQMSDGIRAFVGMMLSAIAGDPLLLLIDEPEAFLHPPLSFKLGQQLATVARGVGKQVIVATHSADFVMGCVLSGGPVTIVRLTHRAGAATARELRSDDIARLMRDPLLRSTGILTGLFYDYVVVSEGDSDRAFYAEINERLQVAGRGVTNCLFVNAQGKDTVHSLVRPLRQLGIPTAAVVDIDVIKVGGDNWMRLLEAAGVPELDRRNLADMRATLLARFVATGKDMKRDGGIDLLRGDDRQAAANFLARLADYGLFIVHGGEVESWLRQLDATGSSTRWLVQIFERMGADPADPTYVRPSAGDVWQFVDSIGGWLTDAQRKGIPP